MAKEYISDSLDPTENALVLCLNALVLSIGPEKENPYEN